MKPINSIRNIKTTYNSLGKNTSVASNNSPSNIVSNKTMQTTDFKSTLEQITYSKSISPKNLNYNNCKISNIDTAHDLLKFTQNQILMQACLALAAQCNLLCPNAVYLLNNDSENSYKVHPIKKSNYLPLNKK
ncbi:flagellin [Clostridium sp. ZS2-4]|uniref:flagellin n=1 Tax=Clostridium sp. ZS2-4 TaxID=2987703 RepID=UPI00227D0D55|nr:flagellin [Clostridium sp. ZS2-4]MCY6356564.1 flagellin [Clostridium sp. ZS2-4]